MSLPDVWTQLRAPFGPESVKERQGPKQHQGNCEKQYGQCQHPHKMLSYVDARDVEARLDDVLTPAGWDFMATIVKDPVVQGRLVVFSGDRAITREDFGYPNGDDDSEPIKSAVSDALKRCAVQLGIGRHLYTDNKAPRRGARQSAAPAPAQRQGSPSTAPKPSETQRPPSAPTVASLTVQQALDAIKAAGIDSKTVSAKGKEIAGTWSFREMTGEQRAQVVAALTGVGGAVVPAVPPTTPPTDDDPLWAGMEVRAA